MSRIWEKLNDPETTLVFDIDGTLISYNYGEFRAHHELDRAETEEEFRSVDIYNGCRGIPAIRDFLKNRDPQHVYCLSMEPHQHDVSKKKAVHMYYGILPSHVFLVEDHSEKPGVLKKIAEASGADQNNLVFIDDNSMVLRRVEEETGFSTAHVTVFFEDHESTISFRTDSD